MKKKYNYKETYSYAKQGMSRDELTEMFGVSRAVIYNIIAVGDALMEDSGQSFTMDLSKVTPREPMAELARRGYSGKLTVTKEVDINSL